MGINVQKIKIVEKSRKLKANWTVELDAKLLFHVDDSVYENAAKELAAQIDFEMVCKILTDSGWKLIQQTVTGSKEEIEQWSKQTCKGMVQGRGNVWLFENPDDIPFFLLRWT